jgi:hypothetical protein
MLEWVQSLPLEYRFEMPDGTRVLCVHASPGLDDGSGITPVQTDDELQGLLEGCDADLVLVGHTHWPLDRQAGGVRAVNPGSVAYPWAPDLRASYAVIEADAASYTVEIVRVPFDIEAVLNAIRASGYYPNPEWLIGRYSSDRRPSWQPSSEAPRS